MNDQQLDANELVNTLLEEVGNLNKQIILLKIHLAKALQDQDVKSPEDEVDEE